MRETVLLDRFSRRLNYMRVSVTDRCNLRCAYCVPRNAIPRMSHHDILRYEEILRILQIGVSLGITKIRITGGEPLVRKDLLPFMDKLTHIEGLSDIALTTNGLLLQDYLEPLRAAGIKRLNISLDTLRQDRYAQLTGQDGFDRVWKAIESARKIGFSPIKINVVAMRGVNDDEFEDLASLTRSYPYHVRFIEYMPMGNTRLAHDPYISNDQVRRSVERRATLAPVTPGGQDGPAQRFRYPGAPGEVGFISPRSHHFCERCNRLRLTAAGKLRPCLLSNREFDLITPLRAGATDAQLAAVILEGVRHKPMAHGLAGSDGHINARMSSIGG
ncbi:MAG: GTP 3',8-cyclase MoaA [Desulfobacterales bacterium]